MTYSTSCSSSSRAAIVAAGLAACLAGCAAARPALPGADVSAPRPQMKVLVLPSENLSEGPVAQKALTVRVDQVVAMAGADVIGGARVDDYLAKYRIRYTGGIDRTAAQAAREDLGADAVMVTTIELSTTTPPRIAITMRLVSTGDDPSVLWMDGYARSGLDSPGLFGLGVVNDYQVLQAEALAALRESLAAYLEGRQVRAPPCPAGGWFRPRLAFRARPDERKVATVAVLPFVNETRRRGAGEVVALQFARQFAAAEEFHLLEPGIVRNELLLRRIVMEDGVSLDQARLISGTLEADLVVAGYVFDYDDALGAPFSNFTVLIIDRKTARVVWESTSFNRGTDSGTLFELNTVSTAPRLTCRMVRNVLDGLRGVTGRAGP
jgi:hypothetical protein